MLDRFRIPGLGGWGEDPLWGRFYDWTVEHPQPGALLWRAGIGSDVHRLGPGATSTEVHAWLAGAGFADIALTLSGAIGYFRATMR